MHGISVLVGGTVQDRLRLCFRMLDTSGDGKLDLNAHFGGREQLPSWLRTAFELTFPEAPLAVRFALDVCFHSRRCSREQCVTLALLGVGTPPSAAPIKATATTPAKPECNCSATRRARVNSWDARILTTAPIGLGDNSTPNITPCLTRTIALEGHRVPGERANLSPWVTCNGIP
eukprot:SAG31_NODE_6431_length_2024_cov_1.064416_2_plen_175_part_00